MTIKVNDVIVEPPDEATPRFAAVHELLRQRAVEQELLTNPDAASDEAVQEAIEQLLKDEVEVPDAGSEECRRWYETHADQYRNGELVHARHILFQITAGAPVAEIRSMAESMLRELRHDPDLFAERARENSNCPSGAHGGQLGQLSRGGTVPEFEKAVFDNDTSIGVLSGLVQTRFGFHIVAVDQRIPGEQLPFEAVAERVAGELREKAEERALQQYIQMLAGQADVEGVTLNAAGSPLVQ